MKEIPAGDLTGVVAHTSLPCNLEKVEESRDTSKDTLFQGSRQGGDE